MPVPDRLTVCGLPPPLSVIESVPLRLPLACGVNVTLIVQNFPAPNVVPQLFVSTKSPAFLPVIPTFVMLRLVLPLLVIVTGSGPSVVPTFWLPKFRVVLERLTTVPVPVSETVCGLPAALSVIETEAVRMPFAVGLKVTLMLQLAPAATLVPQVFVCEKSVELVPVTPMLVIVRVALPVLVRVTFCAGLRI